MGFDFNSPGGQAAVTAGLGLASGMAQGVYQGKQNDKQLKATQQQDYLRNYLLTQQQNPYMQHQFGQRQAMLDEVLGGASQQQMSFDPKTGMGSFSGGMHIPQGGFTEATKAHFTPEAAAQAKGAYDQQLNPVMDAMRNQAFYTDPKTGQLSATEPHKEGSGFWHKAAKIAGIAAPIAAMAIPGIGPVLGTMMMAGGGAAAGAANGGLKGALLGGAAGAIPGVGGAALGKVGGAAGQFLGSGAGKVITQAGLGAAAGGVTGGGHGAIQGGAQGALTGYVNSRMHPTTSEHAMIPGGADTRPLAGPQLAQGEMPQSPQLAFPMANDPNPRASLFAPSNPVGGQAPPRQQSAMFRPQGLVGSSEPLPPSMASAPSPQGPQAASAAPVMRPQVQPHSPAASAPLLGGSGAGIGNPYTQHPPLIGGNHAMIGAAPPPTGFPGQNASIGAGQGPQIGAAQRPAMSANTSGYPGQLPQSGMSAGMSGQQSPMPPSGMNASTTQMDPSALSRLVQLLMSGNGSALFAAH